MSESVTKHVSGGTNPVRVVGVELGLASGEPSGESSQEKFLRNLEVGIVSDGKRTQRGRVSLEYIHQHNNYQ